MWQDLRGLGRGRQACGWLPAGTALTPLTGSHGCLSEAPGDKATFSRLRSWERCSGVVWV